MGALSSIVGLLFGWIAEIFLKRWGLNVFLAAGVLASYTACYAAFLAALVTLSGLMPSLPFVPFVTQFFPSASAVAFAVSAYFGSMAVKKACMYWVKAFTEISKIGAS
jgi:hypothetical protein